MRINFGHPISWAIGLGLLAAVIAGTVVPSRTAAQEIRHILGYFLIFAPSIYLFITRRETDWERKHPNLRFVVFLLTMTVATVVLVQFVTFAVDGPGGVRNVLELLAGMGGFLITIWMTFYGGAERLWRVFLSRTDVNW
ncbi:hypothetical protein ACERIT_15445 [Halopenitus sp. H-Gu1]|uniref:hypothetical protein n=1 Tax=Halopenitus sp. H-Gu1 TaxID=3242697 RepID=UPI00359D0F06